jgi:hypothetical protein
VYWKQRSQSLSAVAIVLVLAACSQEEKATSPPAANPAAEAKSRVDSGLRRTEESDRFPQGARKVDRPTNREAIIAWRKRFRQQISPSAPLPLIRVNETVTLPVVVKNLSEEPWPATGDATGQNAVRLAYHWVKKADPSMLSGNNDTQAGAEVREGVLPLSQPKGSLRKKKRLKEAMIVFEGLRTALPRDLPPGETAALRATIQGPPQAGELILRLTMVREGVAWFEQFGGQPLDLPITVTAQ